MSLKKYIRGCVSLKSQGKAVEVKASFLFRWEECPGSLGQDRLTMRLNSTRNFILYDDKEDIVRYIITELCLPLNTIHYNYYFYINHCLNGMTESAKLRRLKITGYVTTLFFLLKRSLAASPKAIFR
jgi:hypothetical protein